MTAEEFFTTICVTKRRPPWSAVGTTELSQLLDINPQNWYNWSVRMTAPAAEPTPHRTYRGVGPRKLYRYESVLDWLADAPRPTPWFWARRYLLEAFLWGEEDTPPGDNPEDVLRVIEQLERDRIDRPRWRWRSVEAGLENLRQAWGVPEPAALAA